MKNKAIKTALSIMLSLMLIMLAMPLASLTAFAETYYDFEYNIIDDNSVIITGYKGSEDTIEIPDVI